MIVHVHLKDGRTEIRFATRGQFRQALQKDTDPAHEEVGVKALVRSHGEGNPWRPIRVRALNRNSVALALDGRDVSGPDPYEVWKLGANAPAEVPA